SIVEEILLEELDLLLRERMGRPRDDDHRRVARHAALAKELELARLVAGGLEVARDRAQHRARAAQRGLTVTLGEVDALSLALGEMHDRTDHRLLTAERADRSRDRDVARGLDVGELVGRERALVGVAAAGDEDHPVPLALREPVLLADRLPPIRLAEDVHLLDELDERLASVDLLEEVE